MKTCTKCGNPKPISSFSRNKNKPDGLHIWCKECANASAKDWRSKNKNYVKSYYIENKAQHSQVHREWVKNNREKRVLNEQKRRAHKAVSQGNVTLKDWKELVDSYGGHCLCCGKSGLKLTMDHIVPLSEGGLHAIDNIQPLCVHCNCTKFTNHTDYRTKYDYALPILTT
jgi:5-methylcytosine-specific restriction endonuclease McrA